MKITATGGQWDRQWMLTNPNGSFLSQRTDPSMALISTEISHSHLIVNGPNMSPLEIPLAEDPIGALTDVSVFNKPAQAKTVGPHFDQWFSDYLQKPCHLVRSPSQQPRRTSEKYDPSQTPIGFADGFPFLILSLQSLENLNSKLVQPVPMERFRPNLVIDGSKPHIEDEIKEFSIGDIRFYGRKPCTRCSIVTVDPTTGKKSNTVTQTLLTYRKSEKGVTFGQNLCHENLGTIAVGEEHTGLVF